jgi:hypothetical protein
MRKFFTLAIMLCCIMCTNTLTAQTPKAKSTQRQASKSIRRGKSPKGTPGQYPEASDRLLIEKDVEHLTPWGMKVMQNEIYARHGYIFKDAALRKHFRKEKWYKGKEKNMKNIRLTDTETENITFIRQRQNKAKL